MIHIDFSRQPDFCDNYRDYLTNIIDGIREELLEAYPQLGRKTYNQLAQMIKDTEDSFVFILDEWDSAFYESFMKEDDKRNFLKWLKGLLKDQPYVELAYMTGCFLSPKLLSL